MIPKISSEKLAWIALHRINGVGRRLFQQLLQIFGTAEQIIQATPEDILMHTIPRMNKKICFKIAALKTQLPLIKQELKQLAKNQIQVITYPEKNYPPLLKRIQPPWPLFYYKGNEKLLSQQNNIAIVGTRTPSINSRNLAFKLAKELSQAKFNIVSGFAPGIDLAAHSGTLKNGGKTILVLCYGLKHWHPTSNYFNTPEFFSQALLISQFPPSEHWSRGTAMSRNLTTAACSKAVVVIESKSQGGSMETAKRAKELNIPVFTIKPNKFTAAQAGNKLLLDNGAIPLDQNISNNVDKILNL